VVEGEDLPERATFLTTVFPPVNGTPTTLGRVTSGVEKLP
jgi:hypothetical protein